MRNSVLITMRDAQGFFFRMGDKYSATLPSGVIVRPLFLFNAIEIVISVATSPF